MKNKLLIGKISSVVSLVAVLGWLINVLIMGRHCPEPLNAYSGAFAGLLIALFVGFISIILGLISSKNEYGKIGIILGVLSLIVNGFFYGFGILNCMH